MDGIGVYYTIQSKLFEQGLLDKEINQLILEFSLMNLTPIEYKLFLLENDHTDKIIKEWLDWKEKSNWTEEHDEDLHTVIKIWLVFSRILQLDDIIDKRGTMLTWIAIEKRKSKLSLDDDKVAILKDIEDFLLLISHDLNTFLSP